jgi:hypothetical protein
MEDPKAKTIDCQGSQKGTAAPEARDPCHDGECAQHSRKGVTERRYREKMSFSLREDS